MEDESWFRGWIDTPKKKVAKISTDLSLSDRLGRLRVRLGIGRSSYRVEPGLYAVGVPDAGSPVLVSANYKLSFDVLRRSLAGIGAWILVIDTRGVNVWCSAGKGTFSAGEIARMAQAVGLDRVVGHRKLVLPQLSGSGVAAHEVPRLTGFEVVYGPVRASDLPRFLESGMTATPEMRRVRFGFADRLLLTPMEVAGGLPIILAGIAIIFVAAGLNRTGISFGEAWSGGARPAIAFVGAFLAGGVLTPLLLPWIPFRSFAAKGALVGLLWAIITIPSTLLAAAASLLLLPSISGYLALNFTGATTFTSPSGVRREIRFALPIFIAAFALGSGLIIAMKIIELVSGG